MAKRKRTNPRRQPASVHHVNKAKKQATDDVFKALIAIPLMALHDVYGFGPKRIEAVCDEMLKMFFDMQNGHFSADEANDWLWEYAGIRVEEKR